MLRALRLCNVGPAPELELTLAPRLNLITGDNGLGKSFLLDVAWRALTRKWPQDLNPSLTSGYAARPIDIAKEATIELEVESKAGVDSALTNRVASLRPTRWMAANCSTSNAARCVGDGSARQMRARSLWRPRL